MYEFCRDEVVLKESIDFFCELFMLTKDFLKIFRKYCGKRRKCWKLAFSPFSHNVFSPI